MQELMDIVAALYAQYHDIVNDILLLLVGFILVEVGRHQGRRLERKWFFSHAQILTLTAKDAVKLGGGLVWNNNGIFHVTPADERRRRASSMEDAVVWAKHLNRGLDDVSFHLMPPEGSGSDAMVVYLLQPCSTPLVVQESIRAAEAKKQPDHGQES